MTKEDDVGVRVDGPLAGMIKIAHGNFDIEECQQVWRRRHAIWQPGDSEPENFAWNVMLNLKDYTSN